MFWKQAWPLLLLSIFSFIGFGILVWFKPLGDGYAQTYSPGALAQLPGSENQAESTLRTTPEKSLATEINSGAGESLELKAMPSAAETTDQGESLAPGVTNSIAEAAGQSESPSPGVMNSIVGSATSAGEGGWQPALQSSVGTPGNSVIFGGTSYSPGSVAVSTMVIVPVSNPAPVGIPPRVTEAIFDPLIESPLTEPILESAPQPKGQCSCQSSW